MDTIGGLHDLSSHRAGDVTLDRLTGKIRVYWDGAAGKGDGVQVAEKQVGVGHRRLVIATPVTGRAGHRAGALRPDFERSGLVQPSDAAAAGADLRDINDRQIEGITAAANQRAAR